jgi:hypothetical protein
LYAANASSASGGGTSYALPGVPPTARTVAPSVVAIAARRARILHEHERPRRRLELLSVDLERRGALEDEVELLRPVRAEAGLGVLRDHVRSLVGAEGADPERRDAERPAHVETLTPVTRSADGSGGGRRELVECCRGMGCGSIHHREASFDCSRSSYSISRGRENVVSTRAGTQ